MTLAHQSRHTSGLCRQEPALLACNRPSAAIYLVMFHFQFNGLNHESSAAVFGYLASETVDRTGSRLVEDNGKTWFTRMLDDLFTWRLPIVLFRWTGPSTCSSSATGPVLPVRMYHHWESGQPQPPPNTWTIRHCSTHNGAGLPGAPSQFSAPEV